MFYIILAEEKKVENELNKDEILIQPKKRKTNKKILNNEKLLKFLFFLYLSVSKEDTKEYVNYLGISENDIVSSFKTKGERNLYKKLMNKR